MPEKGDFASAGVVEGDEIISVNGIRLRYWFDFLDVLGEISI